MIGSLRGLVAALLVGGPLLLAAGAVPVAGATEIEALTSPGGIRAWLVREPSIPMISVELSWRGGAELDPDGKEGLANMVSSLLDEGAGDLDSQAFQMRLEELAISLGFDAGRDAFGGHLRTLSENREEAFRLLGLALNRPRFDAEPVDRIRGQILAGLIRDQEDADSVASRTFFRVAFAGHPYGRPVKGTAETVEAITIDDLGGFVGRRLARDNLVIGVVGDIESAELGRLLDGALGSLPARADPAAVGEADVPAEGSVTVIDKDNPQSVAVFGQAGIKRDDPDWYAAYVMNYVLGGGGFTSRLQDEVREKRGLAYSVYSYLFPLDSGALHIGGVATQNERLAESLEVVRREFERLRDEGVGEQELADAKTYLNGSFPLRLSSNAGIARLLVAMQREDLGIDYLDRRSAFIDAVTAADVGRVAKRLLKPDDLIVVVVGRPKGIGGGG